MLEINPLILINDKPQKEGKDYKFKKNEDGSFEILFNIGEISAFKIENPIIVGANPRIYFADTLFNRELEYTKLDYTDYEITVHPGYDIQIWFFGLPVKKLTIVPQVLDDKEERKYKAQKIREERAKFEKEHRYLWK